LNAFKIEIIARLALLHPSGLTSLDIMLNNFKMNTKTQFKFFFSNVTKGYFEVASCQNRKNV